MIFILKHWRKSVGICLTESILLLVCQTLISFHYFRSTMALVFVYKSPFQDVFHPPNSFGAVSDSITTNQSHWFSNQWRWLKTVFMSSCNWTCLFFSAVYELAFFLLAKFSGFFHLFNWVFRNSWIFFEIIVLSTRNWNPKWNLSNFFFF